MSSYINNLCAILGIVDQSRVKIVGIYHGSSKVETVIESAAPATDETT